MGVPNHNLDALEQQRLTLEDNILQLQKSLYHWRTWEAEYDGLREEIGNLEDDATPDDILTVGREYGGALVDEKEMRALLGKEDMTRSPGQVVDLLGRRIDYVKQNIATMEKRLRAAEDELYAMDTRDQWPADSGAEYPMREIMEELDEEGRVVSSSINTPGDQASQLLGVLKKAGVKDIPDTENKKADATTVSAAREDQAAPAESAGEKKKDVASSSQPTVPDTNFATGDDNVDVSRPVSLVTEEDREEPPVTDVDESPEEAKLRREMLQYGINEVGAIVAELELDEGGSDVSIDEDYDYETDEDENEDEFGRSYPVLTEEYHQQMRELEAKLNARGMWNMGKDAQSFPNEVKHEIEDLSVVEDKQPQNSIMASDKGKKPKKKVAFADDLDIAPASASKAPVDNDTLPPQTNTPVLSDSIVERTESTQEARPADPPRKVSRFRSARNATSDSNPNGELSAAATAPTKPSKFAESSAARKQTNTTPSSVPPPLFPATPKEPKPFSTPITDVTDRPSAPQPPQGKTLADKLVERDVIQGSAVAPEIDDVDEEAHCREIASEFYRMRNHMARQNGGTEENDEKELFEPEDPPKRVSKFKASRMA
ncbi:hypothetical protein NUU61_005321 [Penicillium alfredii]|uniref:DUF3835 domain-containing protein n=1 Tax=Penicillium alfredii TaxID=1506179 RepID=A0A9W9F9F3_9EURO|nr:uncharacterized protein NUU61_005321 [Penicillium alfredii]KAJ5095965.1 hypothetical protein NUU61_005321 [Penicillium alfredii]